MFQRAISFSATLLLVGTAVLLTAGPARAQRGGGGHGGGFHAGSHVGGYHGGGVGGYHGGYHHGGYGRSFGYRPYNGHHGYYRGYYPYYGYYPYFSGGGSLENAYADDMPYLGDSVTYDSGYKGLSEQEYQAYAQAQTANNGSVPMPVDTTAHVTVSVPSDAEIWFDGTKTNSAGSVRQFQSPSLTPGERYNYAIRARWTENGHQVTQTQKLEVSAGGHFNLTFPVRPTDTQ
jgi:uncharacterized protein (TIGR03000 family)